MYALAIDESRALQNFRLDQNSNSRITKCATKEWPKVIRIWDDKWM